MAESYTNKFCAALLKSIWYPDSLGCQPD